MRPHKLILIALGLLCAAPATAGAQATDPTLKLTSTAKAPGESVTLTARCAQGCTLELEQLSVLRFDAKGQQGAGASTVELDLKKKLPKGKPVKIGVPMPGSTGALARQLVSGGEYARVAVNGAVSGPAGDRPVQRTIALHQPGMSKLRFADDDGVVRAQKPKGALTKYRMSVSAVQTTTWSYNRDESDGAGCTTISNGSGKQTLKFRTTEPELARLGHRKGKPYFVPTSARFPQVFVGGKLDVDRQGTVNAGMSGDCEGSYGGEDDGGPLVPCNGKVSFDSTVMLYLQANGHLGAYRLPIEEIIENDRGINCPVEMGAKAQGGLEMQYVSEGKADPALAGDPGKYIAILRGSRTEKIPGGTTTTTTRYTVTFKRVGR